MIRVLTCCHISLHLPLPGLRDILVLFEKKITPEKKKNTIKFSKEQIRIWPYFPHKVPQQILFSLHRSTEIYI